MSVSYDLSGKTAIVTGGSKGIGRAIAARLKTAGANVWVWDIAPSRVADAHNIAVDVTNSQQIDAALGQMLGQVSSIDILVNNAGYLGDPLPVEQVSPENWQRVFDVNLKSVFLTSRKIKWIMRKVVWVDFRH